MGDFCCHGNQSFDPSRPKILGSLSPSPVMLHIKFDQDWPTAFRDIQVWKCGRRRTTDDDGRRTDDGPLVYYKLTLWAFGSGELKKSKYFTVKHHRSPTNLNTQKISVKDCNYPTIWKKWFKHRVRRPKHADKMANSVNFDQTASDLGLHCLSRSVCSKI